MIADARTTVEFSFDDLRPGNVGTLFSAGIAGFVQLSNCIVVWPMGGGKLLMVRPGGSINVMQNAKGEVRITLVEKGQFQDPRGQVVKPVATLSKLVSRKPSKAELKISYDQLAKGLDSKIGRESGIANYSFFPGFIAVWPVGGGVILRLRRGYALETSTWRVVAQ